MSLLIEQAGALATLQDAGRSGVRHLGVTQGGAVDWLSHGWANWLLGNPLQAPRWRSPSAISACALRPMPALHSAAPISARRSMASLSCPGAPFASGKVRH